MITGEGEGPPAGYSTHHGATGDDLGVASGGRGLDGVPAALVGAIDEVTVEEFRVEDFRCERDTRLGRQLLFLLSSTEWTRRTSELVEISRARSVDTEVIVDVDLAYAVHSSFRPDVDRVWLPVLTMPAGQETDPESWPARRRRPRLWWRPRRRRAARSADPRPGVADPVTSLEVSDAGGARVPKVPQSEVQYWLAAAIAELLLNRLPRDPSDTAAGRDELVLLASAIRRLLAGNSSFAAGGPAPAVEGLTSPRARTGERVGAARTALLQAVQADLERARPALRSRLGDMIAAVLDTVFVVVAVDRSVGPTSFAIRVPARRLRRTWIPRLRLLPRARLRIDLLTASANTDRLIRLTLPEGLTYLPREDSERHPPLARVEVQEPRPLGELRALAGEVLGRPDQGTTWAERRLASMGADQVDACLAVLGQYRVPPDLGGERDGESATIAVARRLQVLKECFHQVVDSSGPARGGVWPGYPNPGPADQERGVATKQALRTVWAEGAWLPSVLERRLSVNTATPGVVHIRTTAAEGSVMRASPTRALLDVEVAVTESTVLDTARDTSLITLGLLAVVAVLTLVNHGGLDNLDAQTLATVLVLFPAIQAGRIERPDRGSLRGLLAQPTYLLSLATVFPPVALATALALRHGGPDPRVLAVAALAAQALLHLVLRRRPPQALPANASTAAVTLDTEYAPALARLDRIRGRSCRTMIAEALLLGREAHAYVARDPERPGVVEQLLQALDGDRGAAVARRGDGGGLLGLMRSGVAGQALTFVVHGQQARRSGFGGPWASRPAVWPPDVQLIPVPFTPARLAPLESPAWIVEILVGLPQGGMRRLPLPVHPLTRLAGACRDSGFPILTVQHPSPPPVHGRPGLDWLRVRVSVPYVPGEELSGLHRFLGVVDGLRADHPGRGRCSVHVYIEPELATYEAPETAADETSRDQPAGRPRGRGSDGPGAESGTRLAGPGDVIGDDPGIVLPLALCAGARVGLLGDVLDAVARRRPDVRLAGVTVALLHGLSVSFLYCAAAEPEPAPEPVAAPEPEAPAAAPAAEPEPEPEAPASHPAIALGALVRAELEGTDEVHVAVEAGPDGHPKTTDDPRSGDEAVGACPARSGPLLRLQLRTPDRAGVVPLTLARLASVVRVGAGGGPGPGLDIWFALLRVVDGRSLQGRLGIWLPPGDWPEVDWSLLIEEEQRYLPEGRDGGPLLVEDDPVLTVNLARVSTSNERRSQ
jgi:hypothetical protein